jgi:hypothetical protein
MTTIDKGHKLVTGASEESIRCAHRTISLIEAWDWTSQPDGSPIAVPL